MKNGKNALSSLTTQLARNNSPNLEFSKFFEPLTSASTRPSTSVRNSILGVRALSPFSNETLHSIGFGKPSSHTESTSSANESPWQNVVKQTASGGLASLLSGGLSGVAGIGGLFSDIKNLFSGSAPPPPPLVLFSLPGSVQTTAYMNPEHANTSGGSIQQNLESANSSGIYTSSGLANPGNQRSTSGSTTSTAIAQAVKKALLTSNTLGDVIAEL